MQEEYWLERTELLLGKEKIEKLQSTHIIVVGLGGVGAYAAEMLCRAGIGKLSIVDADTIHPSNRNRQLLALKSDEGKPKVQLMAARLKDINPNVEIIIHEEYLKGNRIDEIMDFPYDYVIDAIDTLTPKIYLIKAAIENKLRIISSMGAGGKMDPSQITITDISLTYNDKLARILRKRLHTFGIRKGFKAVFSPEKVSKDMVVFVENEENKKTTVGTISYMPPLFGSFMAAEVLRELTDSI